MKKNLEKIKKPLRAGGAQQDESSQMRHDFEHELHCWENLT